MVIIRIKIAYILVSFIDIFLFLFCYYLFLIVPLCNYTLPSTFSPSPTRFASSTAHVNITSTPSVNTPITTTKVGISSVFDLNIYIMLVLIWVYSNNGPRYIDSDVPCVPGLSTLPDNLEDSKFWTISPGLQIRVCYLPDNHQSCYFL